jgi:lysozyme
MKDDFLLLAVIGAIVFAVWNSVNQSDQGGNYYGTAFAPYDPETAGLNEVSDKILSAAGAAFIKSQENLALTPYWDVNGYSIGYGHHFQSGEAIPYTITKDMADAYFAEDANAAEQTVNSLVSIPLTQSQFDVLVDFVYNEGRGHFQSSTLLAKLNSSDYQGAADELKRWVYAGGQRNQVLADRRTSEYQSWWA